MELERTVSVKGQVVIPKDARKKAGIAPGTKVLIEVEDSKIIIRKKMNAKEFVDDFINIPRKLKKHLNAAEIKRTGDEQYEIR